VRTGEEGYARYLGGVDLVLLLERLVWLMLLLLRILLMLRDALLLLLLLLFLSGIWWLLRRRRMLEASFFHPELDRRAARRLLGQEPPWMVNGERCIRPAPEAVARGPLTRRRRKGRASSGAALAAWDGLLTSLSVGGMFSE